MMTRAQSILPTTVIRQCVPHDGLRLKAWWEKGLGAQGAVRLAVRGMLTCVVCAAVTSTPAFADGACDAMPVTAAKVEWLGHDLSINGVPAQAAMLTIDASSKQIQNAYRDYWVAHHVPTHVMSDGHTLLLSAISSTCSYTLQIPANQGSPVKGLFSAMTLGQVNALPRTLRPANYPLPLGKVTLDMTSQDNGTVARTVQMTLPEASAADASSTYAERLARDGWHAVSGGPALSSPRTAPFGYALAMQKNGYRLDAAFTPASGSTTVVINVAFEE